MVASADGAATLNGRSGGLSGPADKVVFAVLRSLADVILVGAGTARAEHYRPVQADEIWTGLRPEGAPVPAIAVVTSSLDLDSCQRLLTDAAKDAQTIVITTQLAAADRKAAIARSARIIVAGQHKVDADAAIRALASLGYANILVEGGPTLLGELADADLVDELCLTTSPVLAAGPASRITAAPSAPCAAAWPAANMVLAHVLADDGYLLCRYVRER